MQIANNFNLFIFTALCKPTSINYMLSYVYGNFQDFRRMKIVGATLEEWQMRNRLRVCSSVGVCCFLKQQI